MPGLDTLIIPLILAAIILYVIGYAHGKREAKVVVKTERKKAVKASRKVLTGKINERLAPLLPDFPVNPSEACFVNFGVDYLGFPGYHEGNIREVIFIEVKSNSARLTGRQKQIKQCIEDGRVRFVTYKISGE